MSCYCDALAEDCMLLESRIDEGSAIPHSPIPHINTIHIC